MWRKPIESSYYPPGTRVPLLYYLIVNLMMRILQRYDDEPIVLVGFFYAVSVVQRTCSSGSKQMQPQSSERFREVELFIGRCDDRRGEDHLGVYHRQSGD